LITNKFSESGVRAVTGAGVEIYDLVNMSESYNKEEKKKKKKALYNNYLGFY
jgi:hypothetical protein